MGRTAMERAQGTFDAAWAKARDTGDDVSGSAQAAGASMQQRAEAAGTSLGGAARQRWHDAQDAAGSTGEQLSNAAGSAGEWVRQSAADTGTKLSNAAGATYSNVKDRAAAGYGRVTNSLSGTASSLGASARQVGRSTASAGQRVVGFAAEQPLIVAGLGIAIGACLGAMLRTTDTENKLLGEQSDAAKERLGSVASEGYEKAKGVAERAVDAARDEMRKPGPAFDGQGGEASSFIPSDHGHDDAEAHAAEEHSGSNT
jgi:hypothetical protein